MESEFFKVSVLSGEEIKFLKETYSKLPRTFYRRDYNLFNVYKANIPQKIPPGDVDMMRSVITKLKNACGAKASTAHYFLDYIEGSFTNVHFDSPERVNKTAVTLVDASPSLVGGEVVIMKDVLQHDLLEGQSQPEDYFYDPPKKPKNRCRIPILLKQEVGTTLVYDHYTHHGVTRVEQGHRLVLISWFK